jgi:hypothetical protein
MLLKSVMMEVRNPENRGSQFRDVTFHKAVILAVLCEFETLALELRAY